jgi:hypothetical protein
MYHPWLVSSFTHPHCFLRGHYHHHGNTPHDK